MKNYLALAIICISSSLSAQNWNLFNSHSKKFFSEKDTATFSYSIAFDSTKFVLGDSIYYNLPIRTQKQETINSCGNCPGTLNPGWLGNNIVLSNNTYIFLNSIGDSIKLKFPKGVNKQVIYIGNNDSLEISLSSETKTEILGFEDSVKTYKIGHFNKNGSVKPNGLNDFEIKVGKKLGLISFFDVYNFPNQYLKLELHGMKNPDIGIFQITESDIYNYNLNAVVHRSYYSSIQDPSTYGDINYNLTVLSKDTIGDTLIYKMKRFSIGTKKNTSDPYNIYNFSELDTISEKYLISKIYDRIPFEDERIYGNYPKAEANEANQLIFKFVDLCGKRIKLETRDNNESIAYNENCHSWCSTLSNPHVENVEYVLGLGKTYDGPLHVTQYFIENKWNYLDDGVQCGTPVGVKTFENKKIHGYPNPTRSYFIVDNEKLIKGSIYHIYDGSGKIILTGAVSQTGKLTINGSNFANGLYSITVISTDNAILNSSFSVIK